MRGIPTDDTRGHIVSREQKGDGMRLGMVGLGRMGANMTTRLLRDEHEVVAYDVDLEAVERAAGGGAEGAVSVDDLVGRLEPPRAVWMMVPAGDITQSTIDALAPMLAEGDVVIDGGNSRYTDTLARAAALAERGISFVDAGTSGGIWGLSEGYCLMVGASEDDFARLEPLFATLAPPDGYARVGPPGAGHFVKMVHNGIEYALMQGYAEGFELLRSAQWELDLGAIAQVWRRGSVIRSWLLDLAASALDKDPELEGVADYVEDSGEGRWTVQAAVDAAVPAPAMTLALYARFASRQEASFAGKMLAALRQEFGGHSVRREEG
jgi:6-phosphogluconate dehydrogenase